MMCVVLWYNYYYYYFITTHIFVVVVVLLCYIGLHAITPCMSHDDGKMKLLLGWSWQYLRGYLLPCVAGPPFVGRRPGLCFWDPRGGSAPSMPIAGALGMPRLPFRARLLALGFTTCMTPTLGVRLNVLLKFSSRFNSSNLKYFISSFTRLISLFFFTIS